MKMNRNCKKQNTGYRIQNTEYVIRRASLFLFLSILSGCNSGNESRQFRAQIDNLTKDNVQLTSQIEQINSENEQLKKQIAVLQKLPDNVKGENLYQLENVKIHNYSSFYDENKDGKLDTLIVRIQPIDKYGDQIKAAGSVEVELWNLNKQENQAQIGKWLVSSEELKKSWNDTLVTNYRLSFDISGKIDKLVDPLTLKIIFTDYLTGKTFHVQKVIEP
ncbi:MAG: hypothetical protein JW787_08320 [Sedimentisphaerales bacterium]|nr:hypothetical protein [Sedimentisphaerales bacterium]